MIAVILEILDNMTSDGHDIEPFDWFNRFFGRRANRGFPDIFRGFDELRREMEREFSDTIRNMETKDLVKEYETPEGGKVREYGPFVYGY